MLFFKYLGSKLSLVLAFALLFVTPMVFKSMEIRLILWIYAYPIWVLAALSSGYEPTRIIEAIGMGFYYDDLVPAFLYALGSYFLLIAVLWKIRKVSIVVAPIHFVGYQRIILLFVFLAALPIAYPAALGLSESRFGSFASVIVFCASVLISSSKGKITDNPVVLVLMVVSAFMVVRGERVDFILIFLTPLLMNREGMGFGVIASLAFIFLLGTAGLYFRSGMVLDSDSFYREVGNVLVNFGTAVDVIHVYISSMWHYRQFGVEVRPLLNIFFSVFPFSPMGGASSNYSSVMILRGVIDNAGGGLLYTPFSMAGGGVGVLVAGMLYGVAVRLAVTVSRYYGFVFISFFIMQLRLQWYGLSYYGSVIFISLVFVFFYTLLPKKNSAVG